MWLSFPIPHCIDVNEHKKNPQESFTPIRWGHVVNFRIKYPEFVCWLDFKRGGLSPYLSQSKRDSEEQRQEGLARARKLLISIIIELYDFNCSPAKSVT
jgi:hypothetical protein